MVIKKKLLQKNSKRKKIIYRGTYREFSAGGNLMIHSPEGEKLGFMHERF